LTFEANDTEGIDKKQKIRQAAVNICKNPIILSILAGLIVGLLGIQFPVLVNKTINTVAQMATPSCYIMAKSMKNDEVLTTTLTISGSRKRPYQR